MRDIRDVLDLDFEIDSKLKREQKINEMRNKQQW